MPTSIATMLSVVLSVGLLSCPLGADAQDEATKPVAKRPIDVALGTDATADAPAKPPETGSEDEAKGLFLLARAAFERGDYEQALDYFEQSYEESGRAELLYNVGQSADRLRLDEIALDAFEEYLRLVPESPNHPGVRRRVVILKAQIANARQEAPPGQAVVKDQVDIAITTDETGAGPRVSAPSAATASGDEPRDSGSSVFEQWWFWTAAAVVVGGTVAVALIATSEDKIQDPAEPNTGVVVTTLRFGGP